MKIESIKKANHSFRYFEISGDEILHSMFIYCLFILFFTFYDFFILEINFLDSEFFRKRPIKILLKILRAIHSNSSDFTYQSNRIHKQNFRIYIHLWKIQKKSNWSKRFRKKLPRKHTSWKNFTHLVIFGLWRF